MSQEDVDQVRRGYEALNRGDVEGLIAVCDPEIELVPLRVATTGSFRRHDGIRAFMRDNEETFDAFSIEPREFRDLGKERVLVIGTVRVRAHGSGALAEQPSAAVVWLRDGRALRIEDFSQEERALAALG